MSILKYVIATLLAGSFGLTSSATFAQGPVNDCDLLNQFYAFTDGMQAYQKGDSKKAVNIFCSLALQGDDRAQFRLAQYYAKELDSHLPHDVVTAYAWSKLANFSFSTVRKTKLVTALKQELNAEELAAAEDLYRSIVEMAGTGDRINQQHRTLDLDKIFEQYNRKVYGQTYTGSRIKGRDPESNNLIIIQ